jgi:hypothetical protein
MNSHTLLLKRWFGRSLAAGCLAILLLLLAGWGSTLHATPREGARAMLRLVHASPDVGVVNVFVDGKKTLTSFAFASVTDYLFLPAGSHKIQIATIGKGIDAAVISQTMQITGNTTWTVAALGTKESGFWLASFEDNNIASGTPGGKVRIYQLAPWTAKVSVDVNQVMVAENLVYPRASDYRVVPAGTYTARIMLPANLAPLSFSVTLKDWTVTSVFTIGAPDTTQKLKFVTTQVNAIPQMPRTGSDPYASPIAPGPHTWSPAPWILLLTLPFGAALLYGGVRRLAKQAAR